MVGSEKFKILLKLDPWGCFLEQTGTREGCRKCRKTHPLPQHSVVTKCIGVPLPGDLPTNRLKKLTFLTILIDEVITLNQFFVDF